MSIMWCRVRRMPNLTNVCASLSEINRCGEMKMTTAWLFGHSMSKNSTKSKTMSKSQTHTAMSLQDDT